MNIASLATAEVVTVDAGASLREAAILMREQHVGALVVTAAGPQGARVAGVVTDRDLAVEGLARGLDPAGPVGALVAVRPVAIPGSAGVAEAGALMRAEGVRRLLVIGPEQQLAGVVSLDDLVGALAGELGALAGAIQNGYAREAVQRKPVPPIGAGAPVHVPPEALAGAWRRTPQL